VIAHRDSTRVFEPAIVQQLGIALLALSPRPLNYGELSAPGQGEAELTEREVRLVGSNHEAVQQRVEADEAELGWSFAA
jgi:hypothetical protein